MSEVGQAGAAPARSDLVLIAAVLRKDRKATAEFVDLYADAVYSYVRWRLSPREDQVEDVVQQVFLSAWESLAGFRGQSSVRAWLLGIARHKIQDLYRARLVTLDSLPERDSGPGVEETVHAQVTAERVRAALDRLPELYRIVLLWRYWEKMSTEEMARQTGKSAKAIERLLARAREQFRRCYGG